jgi:hypothetical protein
MFFPEDKKLQTSRTALKENVMISRCIMYGRIYCPQLKVERR